MTDPCPPCKYPDDCACEEYQLLADELAFPVDGVECADTDCALRDGHTVPHMSDLELARYDERTTQKIMLL